MNENIMVWFYGTNKTRVAKMNINHVSIVAHRDLIQLNGVVYRFMGAHPEYARNGAHYCTQVYPLVIRDVVEGLE